MKRSHSKKLSQLSWKAMTWGIKLSWPFSAGFSLLTIPWFVVFIDTHQFNQEICTHNANSVLMIAISVYRSRTKRRILYMINVHVFVVLGSIVIFFHAWQLFYLGWLILLSGDVESNPGPRNLTKERKLACRLQESPEQKALQLQKDAQRKSESRSLLSPTQIKSERVNDAAFKSRWRSLETPEQSGVWRTKDAASTSNARSLETTEQSQMRREKNAARSVKIRLFETRDNHESTPRESMNLL